MHTYDIIAFTYNVTNYIFPALFAIFSFSFSRGLIYCFPCAVIRIGLKEALREREVEKTTWEAFGPIFFPSHSVTVDN